VYRSTNSGAGYELVGGNITTTFVDELAVAGTTYYYVVAASDEYGTLSSFSNAAKVTAAAPPACVGDCNQSNSVTVDELLVGVNIALGNAPLDQCRSFDASGDGAVTIDEILTAVNNALNGCPSN
jgi:fibronectin type 3 domain-containing protein